MGLMTTRRHRAAVARVRVGCADQIARATERVGPVADRAARRRAATYLYERSETWKRRDLPLVVGIEDLRRVLRHELETAANDILRED